MPKKLTLEDAKLVAISRKGKCVATEYKNNRTKMPWICEFEHDWLATFDHIKNGSWCPICDDTKKANGQRYSIDYVNSFVTAKKIYSKRKYNCKSPI
jgi:hypothetical protein